MSQPEAQQRLELSSNPGLLEALQALAWTPHYGRSPFYALLPESRRQRQTDEEQRPEPLLPDRETIFRLARQNPIMYAALQRWSRKDITWEQAMYLIIVALVQRQDELCRELVATRSRQMPAPILIDDPEFKYDHFTVESGDHAGAGDASTVRGFGGAEASGR